MMIIDVGATLVVAPAQEAMHPMRSIAGDRPYQRSFRLIALQTMTYRLHAQWSHSIAL